MTSRTLERIIHQGRNLTWPQERREYRLKVPLALGKI